MNELQLTRDAILREIDHLRGDVRDAIEEMRTQREAQDSEISELKLQVARMGSGISIKRDSALAGGSATVTAALLALIQWLTSAPPPRAERPHRERPAIAVPAPEVPRAP